MQTPLHLTTSPEDASQMTQQKSDEETGFEPDAADFRKAAIKGGSGFLAVLTLIAGAKVGDVELVAAGGFAGGALLFREIVMGSFLVAALSADDKIGDEPAEPESSTGFPALELDEEDELEPFFEDRLEMKLVLSLQ